MSIPNLERIVFFNGESLTAGDLTALDDSNRQLRWLHNRSLHNWGIAIGLEAQGNRGDTAVIVQPGYGIDSLGREIILTEAVHKPIPAVPGAIGGGEVIYYLTASYLDDSGQSVEERRDGVCLPGGTVRLSEGPSIDWRLASQLRNGIDLILAQIWVLNCQLSRDVSGAPRRYARACQLPYFRAGRVSPKWSPWIAAGHTVGFEAAIDTSAALFQSVPRYSVELIGPRTTIWSGQLVLAYAMASVAGPTPHGFTVQVALPEIGGFANPKDLLDAVNGPKIIQQFAWQVVWIGVEG